MKVEYHNGAWYYDGVISAYSPAELVQIRKNIKQQNAALRQMLRRVDFMMYDADKHENYCCVCGNKYSDKHAKDCALKKLLEEEE